ncbi:asparagine synthase-related protein [Ferrimonas sp. YFM]|uniref:asparagine synthase-related protein n=1 Tax=Ferrimonas sp. YFM TaxID=3028878 RepID=UPI00257363B5|nr:asparagine synthase-related protein [Ferrimonas sp. YFM]BDY04633.1 hypothetical protein F0521_16740 [Ferrimonas sp. YFM]
MSLIMGFYTPQWQAQHHDIAHTLGERYPFARCIKDDRCVLLCESEDNWGSGDWHQRGEVVMCCFGHPLLSGDRHRDLIRLTHEEFDPLRLHDAQGSYLLVHYNRLKQKLTLCADPLSIRPFYTMELGGFILFSNRMKPLVEMAGVVDRNRAAQLEFALLGYTLGSHTPYAGIRASRPGEVLSIDNGGLQRRRHHCWHYGFPLDKEQGVLALDWAFKQAVGRYCGGDSGFVSTLSGGMDSRVIATELLRRRANLHCLNFSRHQSQDLWCAQTFAQHHDLPLTVVEVEDTQAFSCEQRLGQHWTPQAFDHYHDVERPRLVWSGNGGSVCVGQIYTSKPLLKAVAEGDPEAVIDAYIEQQQAYVPQALVSDGNNEQLRFKERLMTALGEYGHLPMGKAWQLFLWENDQHQHVAVPFEEMDQFNLDFYLPFYAKGVLEAMFAMPMEAAARHGVYMSWVNRCYPQMLTTPWQTYPGHIPCPLELPESLQHQWQFRLPRGTRHHLQRKGWKAVLRGQGTLNKGAIAARCLADLLGIRDTSAHLKFVAQYERW